MKHTLDAVFMKLLRLAVDYPRTVLAVLCATGIAAGLQLPRLTVVTDIKSMLPFDEIYRDDLRIRDTFNIKDFVIVGVKHRDTIFTPRTFAYVKSLTERCARLEGAYRIRSLFSEDNISTTPERHLDISPFIKSLSPEDLTHAEHSLRNFEAVQGIFISADFTATAILIELKKDAEKAASMVTSAPCLPTSRRRRTPKSIFRACRSSKGCWETTCSRT